uniref:Thioredoxin domain containing 17 n=1 Tax=Ovis aries TaxID=9940 RepID=A0AC11BIN0_SHEEP
MTPAFPTQPRGTFCLSTSSEGGSARALTHSALALEAFFPPSPLLPPSPGRPPPTNVSAEEKWRNPRHRLCSKARFPDGQLRRAEPVVREGLKHVGEGCVFIYCQVGEKPYWKDPNNDFRKNLKLTAVPTLLKYGTPQKLVESECLQANLVEMLFSED